MGFNNALVKDKSSQSTVTSVASKESFDLLKVAIKDVTNGKEISDELVENFQNMENFSSYFTSLRKLVELEKLGSNKDYLRKLKLFKRGLEIYVDIPKIYEYGNLLNIHCLRVIGTHVAKSAPIAITYDSILGYVKNKKFTQKVMADLQKNQPDFYNSFEYNTSIESNFLKWLLEQEIDMEAVINEIISKNLFLTDDKGYYSFTENGRVLSIDEYHYYGFITLIYKCFGIVKQQVQEVIQVKNEKIEIPKNNNSIESVFDITEPDKKEEIIEDKEESDELDFGEDSGNENTDESYSDEYKEVNLIVLNQDNEKDELKKFTSFVSSKNESERGEILTSLYKYFMAINHNAQFIHNPELQEKIVKLSEYLQEE